MSGEVFRAIVGTSRLPLTSVEAPLPAFSFGKLFYTYRAAGSEQTAPRRTWRELVRELNETRPEMPPSWRPQLLETLLHAVPFEEMASAAALIDQGTTDLPTLLSTMFNGVSLSPWTDWTDKLLAFLQAANLGGALRDDEVVDFLAHVLRQLCRHLTAYDLVTFHHRGANSSRRAAVGCRVEGIPCMGGTPARIVCCTRCHRLPPGTAPGLDHQTAV